LERFPGLVFVTLGSLDRPELIKPKLEMRRAGTGYADPDYDLALDWINAADAIRAASDAHNSSESADRILLINGSSRSEHTCPGEMSKSYRLSKLAESVFKREGHWCRY
jgi:hypothetical protein